MKRGQGLRLLLFNPLENSISSAFRIGEEGYPTSKGTAKNQMEFRAAKENIFTFPKNGVEHFAPVLCLCS
ncbi:MAG: hypothetical protein CMI30_12915 [Opitutae bacterium]|nr:hypothetical protein [Opitutae bacterium]